MPEALKYQGAPFDTSVERVDEKVTLKIWKGREVIVEMDMTRSGAIALSQHILRVAL